MCKFWVPYDFVKLSSLLKNGLLFIWFSYHTYFFWNAEILIANPKEMSVNSNTEYKKKYLYSEMCKNKWNYTFEIFHCVFNNAV